MKRKIVVVKKGVDKKDMAAGICCHGPIVPLVMAPPM
jgi:hypothetical protein